MPSSLFYRFSSSVSHQTILPAGMENKLCGNGGKLLFFFFRACSRAVHRLKHKRRALLQLNQLPETERVQSVQIQGRGISGYSQNLKFPCSPVCGVKPVD